MPNKIPESDSTSMPGHDDNAGRRDALELNLLTEDLENSRAISHAIKASICMKRVAAGVCIAVVLFLLAVLGFAALHVIWIRPDFWADNAGAAIALIVAPITSITVLVVLLIIGINR